MKLNILSGILEIAAHAKGGKRDFDRLTRALAELDRKALDGANVLRVHCCQENEPCNVPHFGHSALCGEPCRHEPEAWGVLRYFGVELLIHGDVDLMNVPQAYRVNDHAQFVPCGILTVPFSETGDFTRLERVERQAIQINPNP